MHSVLSHPLAFRALHHMSWAQVAQDTGPPPWQKRQERLSTNRKQRNVSEKGFASQLVACLNNCCVPMLTPRAGCWPQSKESPGQDELPSLPDSEVHQAKVDSPLVLAGGAFALCLHPFPDASLIAAVLSTLLQQVLTHPTFSVTYKQADRLDAGLKTLHIYKYSGTSRN